MQLVGKTMFRSRCCAMKDFDAWSYGLGWPSKNSRSSQVQLVVEDIKFAYNAWCLLRLALFFRVGPPVVMSTMQRTVPSMDVGAGGNRLFFMQTVVSQSVPLDGTTVALTPNHPSAVSILDFPWERTMEQAKQNNNAIQIVLGAENGLSPQLTSKCHHHVYIPQYGSIGSLSMLSALSIAVHRAGGSCIGEHAGRAYCEGHMPLSGTPGECSKGPPHEKTLSDLDTESIKQLLAIRRASYKLQLGILMNNELGDRNIGAVARNANAFNCDQFIVLGRRKFNRRGALGVDKVMNVSFFSGTSDISFLKSVEGYAIWMVYQYYPYLNVHFQEHEEKASTFIPPSDWRLRQWCASHHALTSTHPLTMGNEHLCHQEVYLDEDESLLSAVRQVIGQGLKGIVLAVPEEGSSPHPDLLQLSTKVVYILHPQKTSSNQRGLNPALASAIALHRLRSVIDGMYSHE